VTTLQDYSLASPEWIRSTNEAALAGALAAVESIEALGDEQLGLAPVLGVLDEVMGDLHENRGAVACLAYFHPDAEVRDAARAAGAEQSAFEIDLSFRPGLYDRVRAFSETPEAQSLVGADAKLLADTLRGFRQAGHGLDPEAQARLQALRQRLAEIEVEFDANIAAVTDHLDIPVADLAGMPEAYLASLEPGDEPGTVRVTTAYPHVVPIQESAPDRRWRHEVQRMFDSRAAQANRPLLLEALDLRFQIAGLFDEPSWAHHRLHGRMAATPENVAQFYDELVPRLTVAGELERARLQELLDADIESGAATGDPTIAIYDWRYYDTRLRQTSYGVDQWAVAEYLPLDAVLSGLLDLTSEMFGITFTPVEFEAWHPDVVTLAISDTVSGELLAHAHLDLHPREGKFTHAAAFDIVPGRRLPDGTYQRPVSTILANMTAPTAERPALLAHSEVVTLFHEFGHVLHQTLTTAQYAAHAGTNVQADFVEAPSQIMEHWAWTPQVLARFARHYRTGEPLPQDLLDGMIAAKHLDVAIRALTQVAYGSLDQRLHGPDQPAGLDRVIAETSAAALFPRLPGTCYAASFGHLLGGYDAGYYGYLWSEVYGDDMFSEFVRRGVTNPEVGRHYRDVVLAQGGAVEGMDLLRQFLGREPRQDAFLADKGLA
jgi:thimet oligopeptidase